MVGYCRQGALSKAPPPGTTFETENEHESPHRLWFSALYDGEHGGIAVMIASSGTIACPSRS